MTIFFSLSDFVLCLSLTKYGINHSQVHRSVQCPYCLRQLCLCNYAEKLDAFLLQCPFKRTANELYRGHWHLLLQAQILTFRHIANIKLVGPFFFCIFGLDHTEWISLFLYSTYPVTSDLLHIFLYHFEDRI